MQSTIGNHIDLEQKGCFMLCKSQAALHHEIELAKDAEKFGLQVECLDAAAVQALEPHVKLDVAGAVLFKDDCHLDPSKPVSYTHLDVYKRQW